MTNKNCHRNNYMSLHEAIEYHRDTFSDTKDEWSYKMLICLLKMLNDRDGQGHPNYLELINTKNGGV